MRRVSEPADSSNERLVAGAREAGHVGGPAWKWPITSCVSERKSFFAKIKKPDYDDPVDAFAILCSDGGVDTTPFTRARLERRLVVRRCSVRNLRRAGDRQTVSRGESRGESAATRLRSGRIEFSP